MNINNRKLLKWNKTVNYRLCNKKMKCNNYKLKVKRKSCVKVVIFHGWNRSRQIYAKQGGVIIKIGTEDVFLAICIGNPTINSQLHFCWDTLCSLPSSMPASLRLPARMSNHNSKGSTSRTCLLFTGRLRFYWRPWPT